MICIIIDLKKDILSWHICFITTGSETPIESFHLFPTSQCGLWFNLRCRKHYYLKMVKTFTHKNMSNLPFLSIVTLDYYFSKCAREAGQKSAHQHSISWKEQLSRKRNLHNHQTNARCVSSTLSLSPAFPHLWLMLNHHPLCISGSGMMNYSEPTICDHYDEAKLWYKH